MAHADIKLGYSCNNNCVHCVIASQRDTALMRLGKIDLSTEEYKKELLDSRRKGCVSVTFTGGEPTIRKDLLELVKYAKSLGFSISMQTNGRMFYYSEFAEKFSGFKIKFVIALHSPKAENHDSITRSKGSFKQTTEGIRNLTRLGQRVTGKIVISKKNANELKYLAKTFLELGVQDLCYSFPHAQGNAWKYFDEVVPRYSEISAEIHDTIDFCRENSISVDFEAVPYCFMKGYEQHISEHKRDNNQLSELKQLDGARGNWNIIRKQIKSKFPQCAECKYDLMCEGPWEEYPRKYGSSEFKPVRN